VKAVMQAAPIPNENDVRYKVYNIGNNHPENLLDFVDTLQQELVKAGVLPKEYDFEQQKEFVPMQPGDVETTFADVSELERDFGFRPNTALRDGLQRFVLWYKEVYLEHERSFVLQSVNEVR
jgi:nucleoside-diphosphate-sugar epimerase